VKLTDAAIWREVKVVVGPCPDEEMAKSVAAVRNSLSYVDASDQNKVMSSTIPCGHW